MKMAYYTDIQEYGKKPGGIPLGDNHYLKRVAAGDCLLTNKRMSLVAQFTSKRITLSSIERIRRFSDGIFCNRSSGKSLFLKPIKKGRDWDRFSMLAEHAVAKQPVLGVEPSDNFIPSIDLEPLAELSTALGGIAWVDLNAEPRYTFRVVGDHVADRSYWIELVRIGRPISLIREPENRFDANAVAVFDSNRHQLGYLKREVAQWFGPMMDRGYGFNSTAYRKPASGGLIVAVFNN